jgi:hypothetical protein
MAVLHDYQCRACGKEAIDAYSDSIPKCCGQKMGLLMPRLHAFEWGGPRTYLHLRDEPFSSQSELKSWAKKKGMSLGESSEKVGGARNDMYDGIGKSYSYKGASGRDNPLADAPRRGN